MTHLLQEKSLFAHEFERMFCTLLLIARRTGQLDVASFMRAAQRDGNDVVNLELSSYTAFAYRALLALPRHDINDVGLTNAFNANLFCCSSSLGGHAACDAELLRIIAPVSQLLKLNPGLVCFVVCCEISALMVLVGGGPFFDFSSVVFALYGINAALSIGLFISLYVLGFICLNSRLHSVPVGRVICLLIGRRFSFYAVFVRAVIRQIVSVSLSFCPRPPGGFISLARSLIRWYKCVSHSRLLRLGLAGPDWAAHPSGPASIPWQHSVVEG